MTPSGIESEPILLVVQCLNQLRHRLPNQFIYIYIFPLPQCLHMFLRNFMVSLLVVAIVQPNYEAGMPMRRGYVVPMVEW